jgi:hypothetical protein
MEGKDDEMSNLTKPYAAIDWLNAFFLQWLLLYVPYNWYAVREIGLRRSWSCSDSRWREAVRSRSWRSSNTEDLREQSTPR